MKMYIDRSIKNYSEAIAKPAYESYKKQIETHPGIFLKMYEEYSVFMKQELSAINGLVCMEDEKCLGYLLYNKWEENGETHCRIPEWGYGATKEKREKIISRLFQEKTETGRLRRSQDLYKEYSRNLRMYRRLLRLHRIRPEGQFEFSAK